MIMDQSVEDFFKDRDEYLKRPTISTTYGERDVRDMYLIGIPCCVITEDNYFFKDKNDNEYCFSKTESLNDKQMWEKFDKMIAKKAFSCNVKDILIQKIEDKKKRNLRREKILQHVTPFFIKDKSRLIKKISINCLLVEFIHYWYRYTGCRGVINKNKITKYINLFLKKIINNNVNNILKKFEKQIRKDGGVVEISS